MIHCLSDEKISVKTFTSMAGTIKHYGFVMYGFRSKLICLYEQMKVTDDSKKTLAYFGMCQFCIHFESKMFYRTTPGVNVKNTFFTLLVTLHEIS
jgi:hypothetical protein